MKSDKKLTTVTGGGCFVEVIVVGHISVTDIGLFSSVLWEHFDTHGHPKAIILDLSRAEGIDSTGIATMINLHKKIAPLFIYGLSEYIATMFDRVGLGKVFHIRKTRAEILSDEDWPCKE